MRQMFIDYAQTYEGCELDILVLDTEDLKVSRDKLEYINSTRALEDIVNIVHNVNVDVIYIDVVGQGEVFAEALDNELIRQFQKKAVIKGVKHVSSNVMYGGKRNGHQKEDIYRF